MSHDFAKGKSGKTSPAKKRSSNKKNARKTSIKSGLPSWVWFVAGVIVTLFAQFLVHLASLETDDLNIDSVKKSQQKAVEIAKKTIKRPKIEFYDTLKNREVKVPDDVVEAREQESYNYALQAGAFRKKEDAEQQRVEIILLGLDAKIESRKNKSGTLYHRIIIGPFKSRSKLASARSKLINNNMPSMKIKR